MTRAAMTAVVALTLMSATGCRKRTMPTTTLTMGDASLVVEIADNGERRARGLMYRNSMPTNEGMLFVYPESKDRSFWMKNVRFPLSIAFADEAGTIVAIADMRPMSKKSTLSGAPAMYAIETNKGWFESHGVEVGDTVQGLPGPAER